MNKEQHRQEIIQLLKYWNGQFQFNSILNAKALDSLAGQIVDSIRRVEYFYRVGEKHYSKSVTNPSSIAFDPIKAIFYYKAIGNYNEAFWMAFLSVHCGKHKMKGWNLVRNIYGNLNQGKPWTWNRVSAKKTHFIKWIRKNNLKLKHNASFGNHRKYQSLNSLKSYDMGHVVDSYLNWTGAEHDHKVITNQFPKWKTLNKYARFDKLYKSLKPVTGFGRMAKFDFLTTLGKTGLLDIEPQSPYLGSSTGPLAGVKDLCGQTNMSLSEYESILIDLANTIGCKFKMQVVEDAICNWQKSKNSYKYFSG